MPTDATNEFDLGPLSWVQGEIDQALTRGLDSLAAFKASPKDAIALKHARTHVHQAAGAIQMVGLDAVVAFTDEIERQLTRLEEMPARDVTATVAVVDRACRKLRIFLDELTNGAPPVPLKLFPEYEAMQALRGIKATAPTDLFYPDLSPRAPKIAPREALPASRLASQLVKQRRIYQRGLLSWLRGDGAGIVQMRDAIGGIEEITTHANLRAFWWTVGALFESLTAKGLEQSFGVKQLAARIDLQIRRVVGGSAKVADRLRREALYFVAISAPTGPQVQAVQRAFHLAGLIPSAEVLDADLVRLEPLLREAREQLAGAKDAWLKFASGRAENLPKLKQTLTSVHTKAAEIRNGALMKLTAALVERLDKMPSAAVSEPVAMEYATALLLAESAFENYTNLSSDFPQQVDAMVARLDAARAGRAASTAGAPALDEMSKRAQERMLLAQVGREIQANLRHMEQVLDAFFRDNSKRADLAALAKDSQQIRGALSMLGLGEAARLLASCQEQIESYVNSETPVDNDDLEMLAESLSGLGFYIEAVEQQRPDRDRLIAPLLARRTGEAPTPIHDDDAQSVETAVEELRAQLPRLVAEVKTAPSQAAARQGIKAKLETLRDDAELIGDATLTQQVEAALAELDAGGAAALAKAVDAIADTAAAAPEISAETKRLLETDATQFDAELLEIYLTEASEVLDTIAASRDALAANPSDRDELRTARRGFHTLKGSGRMVGLADLGDLAWEVEKAQNRLLDEDQPVTAAVIAMIATAEAEFRKWVDTLTRTRRVTLDPARLHAAVAAVLAELPFSGGPTPTSPPPLPPKLAEVPPLRADPKPLDAVGAQPLALDLIELPELGAPPTVAPQVVVRDLALPANAADALHAAPSLKLVADNSQAAAGIEAFEWDAPPAPGDADIDDIDASFDKDLAAHLDRGTTDITLLPIDESPQREPVAQFDFDDAANAGFDDAEVTPITSRTPAAAPPAIEMAPFDLRDLVDDDTIRVGDVTLSSALFRILADEADEHIATLNHELSLLQFDPARVPSPTMVRASHTLCGIHRTGGFPIVATTAKALEHALLALAEREPPMPSSAQPVIARAVACLADLVARIRSRAVFVDADQREARETTAELDMLRQDGTLSGADAESQAARAADHDDELPVDEQSIDGPPIDELPIDEPQIGVDAPDDVAAAPHDAIAALHAAAPPAAVAAALHAVATEAASSAQVETPVVAASLPQISPAPVTPALARKEPARTSLADVRDVIEADVLPIFLEEAADLFPQAGNELRGWRRNPQSDGSLQLQRTLHTFKGSARMAGAMRLGELAHQMESRLVEGDTPAEASPALFEALDTDLDHIAYVLDKLRVGESNTALPWIVNDPSNVLHAAIADEDLDTDAQPATGAVVVAFGVPPAAQPMPPRAEALEPEATVRAMLRVRADTVDRLVNEAGEVAIARARIEGEMRMLKANLLELTNSVIRMRSQVREIEIQAESQIQSRMSAMQDAHEGFDPLEFDRYTRFQELTRSLAEGVNDVSTVQQSLLKNLDDADAALVAQARMSREVSQQLFAIRTVPFGSVSERLYRILRATARELDKRANLEIHGSQVELDRSVLEKLVGPLEHLLRNALDHGIEARAARIAAGKSETGELSLTVRQVGNEVVIELVDDGAGIDLVKIAERAKSHNLIAGDARLTDAQLIECIFKPGFSTASQVTQISGRGIGMDVVRTDINALGGRVDVGTRQGKGTTFTIFLPLTLAVAQAVLVRAGGRLWALPAPMVEQVQQVKAEALVNLYVNRKVTWQNRDYPFHYLPRLLGDTSHNPESLRYNPIMLLKSSQSYAAIHVDEMIGNQEIVVKNIGPQLARVSGISGATVLGTGEIVLIINPVQLAQRVDIDDAELPVAGAPVDAGRHAPAAAGPALVLIVDDSLTVRKITSRLLQREGFAVATAKDGIDALQSIGEQIPDVILVDIEMPRMDGFEFTKTLKGDKRNAHIPIIMITSRTADKHRNRAQELGVDVYLGKPYQEEELLRNIHRMLVVPALH